jgi:hypothetical protein
LIRSEGWIFASIPQLQTKKMLKLY